jgi:hypothetical protein
MKKNLSFYTLHLFYKQYLCPVKITIEAHEAVNIQKIFKASQNIIYENDQEAYEDFIKEHDAQEGD